ncbi:MAG: SDR family NAD(P)-dependent oxidoreductase [Anaerolineae bacterium]|nr:SDR family NAD(P)-dependent oxidoreductase [Anaerolineae bacterium]
MKTQNNIVLITGGGSGIGLALAEALLQRDNVVVICGRDPAKLQAAQMRYPALHAIRCDLSDPAQVSELVERLRTDFAGLNVLMNNAAVMYPHPRFWEATADQIEQEIAINLTAVMRLTHVLLPALLQQPEAAVVNISSALALAPREDLPVYCATKAALHTFSRVLRFQLKSTSVKVFDVLPPEVDTEMTAYSAGNKISPQTVAQETLQGMLRDRYEVRIGIVKTLALINRLWPRLAESLVNH